MTKLILVLSVVAVVLIAESTCQRDPPSTIRPPKRQTWIFRSRRGIDDAPPSLWQGDDVIRAPSTADHPFLPSVIDDIKLNPNIRTARSLSTPRASRGGGSRQSSSGDTGPTHPGYNRRNTRSLKLPGSKVPVRMTPPFNPHARKPIYVH